MNRQKSIILLLSALLLMAGTAGLLARMRATQKLGLPGVKTTTIEGSPRLAVQLPENVLDYKSEAIPVDKIVLDFLPQDTSFGQRMYKAPDGLQVQVNVVLMGVDRTSIHKPEFCLGGQGWRIDPAASAETSVVVDRPVRYELPVNKLVVTKQINHEGKSFQWRGVYVYWFVSENELTARHSKRMWSMAREMMRTGVLQRWAYVTYFSTCPPGEEEATFERLKTMINASVPEFQLVPAASGSVPESAKSQ
jgi:hypothetical protein